MKNMDVAVDQSGIILCEHVLDKYCLSVIRDLWVVDPVFGFRETLGQSIDKANIEQFNRYPLRYHEHLMLVFSINLKPNK